MEPRDGSAGGWPDDNQEVEGELLVVEPVTERYARQALKYTKSGGWTYETTVSIKTTDDTIDIEEALGDLNRDVRLQALSEIAVRTKSDERLIEDYKALVTESPKDMSGYTAEDYEHGTDNRL